MAVQLSISQDQAALLLPLLQRLASPSVNDLDDFDQHVEPRSFQHQPIDSSTPNCSMNSESSRYTSDDLLTKAKKNKKSTDAQITSRVRNHS